MQAMGRKKKQKKNKTTPQPIDPDLEDPNILRLFGDENRLEEHIAVEMFIFLP